MLQSQLVHSLLQYFRLRVLEEDLGEGGDLVVAELVEAWLRELGLEELDELAGHGGVEVALVGEVVEGGEVALQEEQRHVVSVVEGLVAHDGVHLVKQLVRAWHVFRQVHISFEQLEHILLLQLLNVVVDSAHQSVQNVRLSRTQLLSVGEDAEAPDGLAEGDELEVVVLEED